MKKIILSVVMLASGAFAATGLRAQSSDEPKKVKVIIHENVNGQESTTESEQLTQDIKQKLEEMGVDVAEIENSKDGKRKVIVKTQVDNSDGKTKSSNVVVKVGDPNDPEMKKLLDENNVQVITNDEQAKIFIDGKEIKTTEGNGDKKVMKIYVKTINMKDASPEECKKAGISDGKSKLQLEDMACTPNPSNGKFNLKFSSPDKSPAEIVVRDIGGKVVYTESVKDFNGAYEKEINLGENTKGAYFVTITQGRKTTTKKMLVE
jgi:hypothetical protein